MLSARCEFLFIAGSGEFCAVIVKNNRAHKLISKCEIFIYLFNFYYLLLTFAVAYIKKMTARHILEIDRFIKLAALKINAVNITCIKTKQHKK